MSSAIRQWLETLGLAQYGDRFEGDDIDLDVLPSLSEQDPEHAKFCRECGAAFATRDLGDAKALLAELG